MQAQHGLAAHHGLGAVAPVRHRVATQGGEFVPAFLAGGNHQHIAGPQIGSIFQDAHVIAPTPTHNPALRGLSVPGGFFLAGLAFHVRAGLGSVACQPAAHLDKGHRQAFRRGRRTEANGFFPGALVTGQVGPPTDLHVRWPAFRPVQEQRHIRRGQGFGRGLRQRIDMSRQHDRGVGGGRIERGQVRAHR